MDLGGVIINKGFGGRRLVGNVVSDGYLGEGGGGERKRGSVEEESRITKASGSGEDDKDGNENEECEE